MLQEHKKEQCPQMQWNNNITRINREKGQTITQVNSCTYLDELRQHCSSRSVYDQEFDAHTPVLDEAGFHRSGTVSVVGGHLDLKTTTRNYFRNTVGDPYLSFKPCIYNRW